MSEKQKSLPNINAELHTISPLPLELIAERIASLNYKGFLAQIDETTGFFQITSESLSKTMLVGQFRRWNGTFTRIDASHKAQSVREWASMLMPFSAFVIVLLLVLSAVQYGFQSINHFFFFACASFFIIPTGITLIIWGIRMGRRGDKRLTKTLDEMMQALADVLTAGVEGSLEFDGSPLSLEFLLQDEKYKHFRLGEDGEFEAQ